MFARQLLKRLAQFGSAVFVYERKASLRFGALYFDRSARIADLGSPPIQVRECSRECVCSGPRRFELRGTFGDLLLFALALFACRRHSAVNCLNRLAQFVDATGYLDQLN